ncbi:MAG: SDR family NAD(P)-dependent oxidoreductase [Thermoflexales bacterium]|nr:SDR family NAD(P)-dependent oxidoreductase [Thermoflexales bacterium]
MEQAYFQGKIALVMGATGGLGSAVARALTAQGATVIAAGRDRAKLDRLVVEQGAHCAYPIDLAVPDQIIALREFIAAHYGALDFVINASGADVRKPLDAHTPDEVRRMLDVNLGGVINLTQGVLSIMRENGVILHVGGFADGRLAFPYYSADVATRAGVAAFVEAINRELALEQRKVIVSYFSPSPTDTEAERSFHPIWREMGVKIEPLANVVAELLTSIQQRERLHIMGGVSTRLFAKLNAAWPQLADRLVMNRYGRILQKHLLW